MLETVKKIVNAILRLIVIMVVVGIIIIAVGVFYVSVVYPWFIPLCMIGVIAFAFKYLTTKKKDKKKKVYRLVEMEE